MNKVNTTKNLKDDEPTSIYPKGIWPLVEVFKECVMENRLSVHIRIHLGEKVSIMTLL